MEFKIEGKDYERLIEFQKEHDSCLEKHPNMTGAQFKYSFYPDGLGVLKTCKCSCGKSITLSSDYDLGFEDENIHKSNFEVIPKDAKTREILKVLFSMEVRPGMYFGKTRSFEMLRMLLYGYSLGTRLKGQEECYWSDCMDHEVWEELRVITSDREYTDEEQFFKFFEALHIVLERDYPQYATREGLIK